MKLSRRDFLKYITLLGSFAPFIDVDKVKENLADFSYDQLKSISEIESIRLSGCSPYCLAAGHTWDNEYYDVYLKSGDKLWLSDRQIEERYGNILDYFLDDTKPFNINDYPAILND